MFHPHCRVKVFLDFNKGTTLPSSATSSCHSDCQLSLGTHGPTHHRELQPGLGRHGPVSYKERSRAGMALHTIKNGKICQVECQKGCQKIYDVTCQKECQNTCQLECQSIRQVEPAKMSE